MLRRAFPTLHAMGLRRVLGRAGRVLVVAWVALLGLVYPFQRKLLYVPLGGQVTPESVGLSGFREEFIATPDGERLLTWVSSAKPGQPTLLYLHGNAGNLSWRADRFHQFQAAGYGVRVLSYRGFGGSTGSPSEAGLIADARAVYDRMLEDGVPSQSLILFGESLGTGVAVQLAASRAVGGVILDSPYTSTADVGADRFPYLPVRWLMWDQFNSLAHIARIGAPLLVVHGDQDTVVPYSLGVRLFAAAVEPKLFVSLPGQPHTAPLQRGAWAEIVPFIDRAIGRNQGQRGADTRAALQVGPTSPR